MTHRRALALAALAGVASCAGHPLRPGEPRVVERVEIAPYAMHEECAQLATGTRLDYRFQSSAPLDFDIHYRESGAVLAPVVREDSTADSGMFEARTAQHYCLAWQAGATGAIISYRLFLRPPR
jgi:hypothetical protein